MKKRLHKHVEKPGDTEANLEETLIRLDNCVDNVKRLRAKLFEAHNRGGHICPCMDCEDYRSVDEPDAVNRYYEKLFDGKETR